MEQPNLLLEQLEITPKHYFAPHTNKIQSHQASCVCCERESKYVCPKCKQFYCSVNCYKQHSKNCTEKFYKENCEEYLKSQKADRQSQQKIKQIIEREREKQDDDINLKQIERWENLYDLVVNNQLDVENLTQDEQRDFFKYIEENDVKKWEPWWNRKKIPSLFIQDQDKKQNKIIQKFQKIPKIPIIENGKVSSSVKYHILSNIYGLCVLFRLYNGDVFTDIDESIVVLEQLCLFLQQNQTQQINLKFAIQQQRENVLKQNFINKQFNDIAIKDVITIYGNIFLIVEMLFKLYDIYNHFQNFIENEITKQNEDQEVKKINDEIQKIGQIKNKIIFYISYMKKNQDIQQLQNELKSFINEENNLKDEENEFGKAKKLNLFL